MEMRVEAIGSEGQPLVILDDFAPDPDGLRHFAAAADFSPARNHYPGVRAALPEAYLATQLPLIAEAATVAFEKRGVLRVVDASFSIVSTPPGELTIPQRLPHVDAFTGDRIALVHYLSPEGGDGTAFFRHRATGFETVTEARRDLFFRHLDTEMRHGGAPAPGYVLGDTPLFETIRTEAARYNRALLYRSWNLHSGAISPATALTADPIDGRLTVTAFLSIG
ncbi:conserved protein of unknown function [uncultured Sphingopyxis sp.]|uniref:Uncharacterized protein n=1 Tax=uncultured Sphingopyxis sp. TaxID=310581 RepID=A0A1Y5PYA3_9SPHN|nr:DUF6445 family protein [uncultured Sphingopyxis sp.]SBV32214.1 conserved protein of unknown function [uncultured Sphingopyxis sp.]